MKSTAVPLYHARFDDPLGTAQETRRPVYTLLQRVEKGDVRALHRARVASRRLRELLPVLQLDAATARKLGGGSAKSRSRSGTVRELDVLLMPD